MVMVSYIHDHNIEVFPFVSNLFTVEPWIVLIRKLRVCLLFSLRLHGESLGPFPITVTNIEDGTIFSIYQWLARDELFFTHKNDEIVAFEESFSKYEKRWFDPSTNDGDVSVQWKMLQQTCIDRHKQMNLSFFQDEKSEAGAAPLLFYFQQFYNPTQLAAHRALILTEMWGRNVSHERTSQDFITEFISSSDNTIIIIQLKTLKYRIAGITRVT